MARNFLGLSLLLLLLSSLIKCSLETKVTTPLQQHKPAHPMPQEKLELTFQAGTQRQDKADWQNELKHILAAYSAIHPQISIRLVDDEEVEAGLRPDISLVTLQPGAGGQPALLPAPSWVETELLARLDEKSFLSACLEQQLYGLPRKLALGTVLIYNKTLLAQAGFDRPPQDTVELVEWAKRLTVYDQKGEIIQAGWAAPWSGLKSLLLPEQDIKKANSIAINRAFLRRKYIPPNEITSKAVMADFKPFLFCFINGAEQSYLFQADYLSVSLNRADVMNALDYYQKFVWEFKFASLRFPQPIDCLKQGLAAMAYLDPACRNELQRDAAQWEWGLAPQVVGKLPYGKYLPAFIPQPGEVWAVTTLDPQKIDICWDVLLFTFLNHDLQLARAEGSYPLLKDNWNTEYAQNHYLAAIVAQQQLRPVARNEYHPLHTMLEALLRNTVCRVVATGTPAEKALNDLALQANLLLRYIRY